MKTKIILKTIALLCVFLLFFTFASCDNGEGTNDTENNTTSEPHIHSYLPTVVEPTCTEKGYTAYTCSCGDSYADSYVDEKGHTKGDWKTENEASELEDGMKNRYCTVCNEKVSSKVIPATGTLGLKYTTISLGDKYGWSVSVGNCKNATDIVIPSVYCDTPVIQISGKAFENCKKLKNIVIPDSVISIGNNAFQGCTGLTSITIPDSVTSIGNGSFQGCTGLTSIQIPDSVTSMGHYAFINCTELKDIQLSNNLTAIGNGVFEHCTKLVTITIPDSVTSIGELAFYGCANLATVTIPDSVITIRPDAFTDCYRLVEVINHSELNITAGSSDYGHVAYYAKEVHTGESKMINQNEYLFYTHEEINYLLEYTGTGTDLILPNDCNGEKYEIYQYAFYWCGDLKSITIPDNVTSIGKKAFEHCWGLTSVTIGNSVASIVELAFNDCIGLTSVTFKGTKAQWESISKGNMWKYYAPFTVVHCSDGDVVV